MFTNKTLGATGAPCRRLGKAHQLHPAESRCFKGRHLSDLSDDRKAREVGRAVLGDVKAAWEDEAYCVLIEPWSASGKRPASCKLQQLRTTAHPLQQRHAQLLHATVRPPLCSAARTA